MSLGKRRRSKSDSAPRPTVTPSIIDLLSTTPTPIPKSATTPDPAHDLGLYHELDKKNREGNSLPESRGQKHSISSLESRAASALGAPMEEQLEGRGSTITLEARVKGAAVGPGASAAAPQVPDSSSPQQQGPLLGAVGGRCLPESGRQQCSGRVVDLEGEQNSDRREPFAPPIPGEAVESQRGSPRKSNPENRGRRGLKEKGEGTKINEVTDIIELSPYRPTREGEKGTLSTKGEAVLEPSCPIEEGEFDPRVIRIQVMLHDTDRDRENIMQGLDKSPPRARKLGRDPSDRAILVDPEKEMESDEEGLESETQSEGEPEDSNKQTDGEQLKAGSGAKRKKRNKTNTPAKARHQGPKKTGTIRPSKQSLLAEQKVRKSIKRGGPM
ncbi:cylicin-2-like [Ambystoma mexicanum]|uniref:cylicin-2-like n=1 Tax=Ambystoma mexicanum TaxID=8296 RepID=UPI0037E8AF08